jgi:hypothetical protein
MKGPDVVGIVPGLVLNPLLLNIDFYGAAMIVMKCWTLIATKLYVKGIRRKNGFN